MAKRGVYEGHEHEGLMLRGFQHPFDSYITEHVEKAVGRLGDGTGIPLATRTYFSYDTLPGKLLAAQHAAVCSGVAFLEPVSHLCLHPTFGPWWSIQAAVVCSLPGPSLVDLPEQEDPITPEQRQRVREAVSRAQAEAPTYNGTYMGREGWRLWLQQRVAVEPNHPKQYSEAQSQYHYTKDLELLKGLCLSSLSAEAQAALDGQL